MTRPGRPKSDNPSEAALRMRRLRAGLVPVTVHVPKQDVKAVETFAAKLRKIAKKELP